MKSIAAANLWAKTNIHCQISLPRRGVGEERKIKGEERERERERENKSMGKESDFCTLHNDERQKKPKKT